MKLRIALMAVVLAVVAGACGGNDDTDDTAADTSTSVAAPSGSAGSDEEDDSPAGDDIGDEPADGDRDEDCGDFECGESCETDAAEYPDQCADWTASGRAPVYDPSWFDDGLFGAYGVSGDYVYGAISGCQEFFAGAGENIYELVDGDSNNALGLTVLWDTESDVADFEFRGVDGELVDSQTAPYDLQNLDDGRQAYAGTFDSGEEFNLLVPTDAC